MLRADNIVLLRRPDSTVESLSLPSFATVSRFPLDGPLTKVFSLQSLLAHVSQGRLSFLSPASGTMVATYVCKSEVNKALEIRSTFQGIVLLLATTTGLIELETFKHKASRAVTVKQYRGQNAFGLAWADQVGFPDCLLVSVLGTLTTGEVSLYHHPSRRVLRVYRDSTLLNQSPVSADISLS